MNTTRGLSLVILFCLAAAVVTAAPAQDPPQYSLTLIDMFEDDFSNYALAVNNHRQVVGYSASPAGRHAWRWTEGLLEDIGSTGGNVIEARDIDDLGRVVGFGNDPDLLWVGWVWDGGPLTLIPSLGGDGSRAWSTNESGEVVGDAQVPVTNFWNAMVWTAGDPVNLGTLGGGNSQAYAINSASQIAGLAVTTAIDAKAVIWEHGGITELAHPAEYPDSVAYGINDAGVAVGSVGDFPDIIIPAMWESETLQLLPHLGGEETKSYAWAVSEPGQAVGWSEVAWGDIRATTWIDGQVYDLNKLVNTTVEINLMQAWDINDQGVIVGMGMMETGPRGFMLVPRTSIPEDVNGDGVVNRLDVWAVVHAFGPCSGCPEDVNGDGVVDRIDLWMVQRAWHGHPHPDPLGHAR